MTTQDDRAVPKDVIDDAKAAGYSVGGNKIFCGSEEMEGKLLKFAKLRDKRQRNTSVEAVGEVYLEFNTDNGCYNTYTRLFIDLPDNTKLFTAPQQAIPAIDVNKMVDRFLGWKLPTDFSPDAGISFNKVYNKGTAFERNHEPIGTNLLNADQAKAMFEYCIHYQSDFNLECTAKRIRRLLKIMDIPDPSSNDNSLMGCLFSLLGMICAKLESAAPTAPIDNGVQADANRWNAFVNLWLMCTELKVTQNEEGGYR